MTCYGPVEGRAMCAEVFAPWPLRVSGVHNQPGEKLVFTQPENVFPGCGI